MKISDGVQESGGQLEIIIVDDIPVEDIEGGAIGAMQPTIIRKQALTVTEGSSVLITNQQIQSLVQIFPEHVVKDRDLSEFVIEYVINEQPVKGTLARRQHQADQWRSLRAGDAFTQAHIDLELIR